MNLAILFRLKASFHLSSSSFDDDHVELRDSKPRLLLTVLSLKVEGTYSIIVGRV